ncbi:RING finger domain protein [Metarhizium robertsii]|uniref:Postreplication repair E3 ubiquitin-protein ligase RAD18 n=2 Tax=Metarhizium robertsii TaxID=568076 RepID=A0A014R177_9HYPO|nr:RING finger domain protein [Metarhizium robertsii]
MPMDDVSDSTDWLGTGLAGLAAVEAALRCQVCKDFYKTPMITTCSHTFCSICIRRALSNDSKCPLCRAPEQELKLRSNWSMEESVEAFSKVRPSALAVARSSLNTSASCKRKIEGDEPTANAVSSEPKRIRTSARLNNRRRENLNQTSQAQKQGDETIPASDDDESGNNEDDDYSEHNTGHADSLVPCPSCQKQMKAWKVFQHLETCPGPISESAEIKTFPSGRVLQAQQPRLQTTLERLPALNYSMLKEQALRKMLAELGISNQGPRLILERRHKEWITIWNANCDSVIPRKKSQLLQDLDVWEKTQGHRANAAAKTTLTGVAIKDKNFDGIAWAAKHDSSFKDLIANARRSRLEAKGPTKDMHGRAEQNANTCFSIDDTHDRTEICQLSDRLTTELRQSPIDQGVSIAATFKSSLVKEEEAQMQASTQTSSTPVAMESANVDALESGLATSNSSETETGGR